MHAKVVKENIVEHKRFACKIAKKHCEAHVFRMQNHGILWALLTWSICLGACALLEPASWELSRALGVQSQF